MTKIFIINAGQEFGHSGGKFNNTVTAETLDFFNKTDGFQVKVTNIEEGYDPAEEVAKFVWADVIIYHTPIWWFQVPHNFKKYIDVVFTEGHANGIYNSDGRSRQNPAINLRDRWCASRAKVYGNHLMECTERSFHAAGRIL